MKTIPSPHGGRLHHRHPLHEGAFREHDKHSDGTPQGRDERHGNWRGPWNGNGHGHGHGIGEGHDDAHADRHRFGPRRRGHGPGHGHAHGHKHGSEHGSEHGSGPGRDVSQAAREIRGAVHSLLHHASSEQLAAAQRLLDETRRGLYLILAAEPESAASEPAGIDEDSET